MKVGIYYPSWNAPWVSRSSDLDLANIVGKYPGLNWVFISFAKPDLSYTLGQNSFAGTGLDFSMEFQVVKGAIAMLRSMNICVMLAVGGATYWSTEKNFYPRDIVDLVKDLGCNGVDIDYEAPGNGENITRMITVLREVLPRDHYISMAGWSTGAYESDGRYAGSAIHACLNAPLDLVNIMAYDAGPEYNPIKAWNAYKKVFKGALMLGFEVGQQGWGGYLLKAEDVVRDTAFIKVNGTVEDGIFVWCDKKEGNPSPKDVIDRAVATFAGPVDDPGEPAPPNGSFSIVCPVCDTTFTS
jgi:hypothetical protein